MTNKITITGKQIGAITLALAQITTKAGGKAENIELSQMPPDPIVRLDFTVADSPYVALIDKEGRRVDQE